MLIDRPSYMARLEGFIDTPVVKVLTGMRRSGKSSLLAMVRQRLEERDKTRVVQVDFDRMEHARLRDPVALHHHIQTHSPTTGPCYVLLDEIQEVTGWERVVNSLVAEERYDIYLTGSNSTLLSSELATYIAGRYVSFEVSTLSYAEYLHFVHQTGQGEDPSLLFDRYLVRGGLPGLFAADYSDDQVRQIVSDSYASTLVRDILTRHQIRSPELFERVAAYALDNIGNTFSARRVSDFLRSESKTIGHQTVADYLSAMTDAYLLRRVRRYDLRGRAHLATQEKYFAGDHGVVTALLGSSTTRLPGLLENIVQAELARRGYTVHVGRLDQSEVDFIGQRHNDRIYLQVATTIIAPATADREYAPLLAIRDSYPKYVLSLDRLAGGGRGGVQHRHLPEFLLDTAWSD